MRVLVTGGGGFLGSHLVRALISRGDQVTILGRNRYPELEAFGARGVVGDVSSKEAADQAVEGVEAVFHTAGKPGLFGPHQEFWDTNVIGTERVIAACLQRGIPRLVHTSSPSVVFGDAPLEGVDESAPIPSHFLASYPETKAEAERRVIAAHRPGRLHTVALRPHLIFGAGDRHLVPRIVERAKAGKLIRVGDGKNLISVTAIDNAVEAHLLALDAIAKPEAPAGGKAYFINEPEPVNLWDFVGRILDGLGVPRPTKSISYAAARRLGWAMELGYRMLGLSSEPRMTRFLAAQLGTAHWFKIGRAERDLGYQPKSTIDQALERLFAAAR